MCIIFHIFNKKKIAAKFEVQKTKNRAIKIPYTNLVFHFDVCVRKIGRCNWQQFNVCLTRWLAISYSLFKNRFFALHIPINKECVIVVNYLKQKKSYENIHIKRNCSSLILTLSSSTLNSDIDQEPLLTTWIST